VRRRRDDEGSVLVLTLGLVAVLLLLVGVVVDVSAVVLAKRSLAATTDGAAVSAAQALDEAVFRVQGPAAGVPLSEAGVQERVAAYPAPSGVALSARVDGGLVAVVTGSRTVRLPFGGWLGVSDVSVAAVARARSPLVP
jgi:Flp pilus assembly protein TadG